jgi:signal transduction histidine kinase
MRTIFADSRGALWLGWGDGRIGRWKNGGFHEDLKTATESDFVNAFFEDAGSSIWVGYSQGEGVGMIPGGEPSQWRAVAGLPYPDVRAMAQAADGAMWFGTHYGGAFRWQNGYWTKFTTRDGLVSDYVRCLKADADGTMWLGTMSGLCRYREGLFKGIRAENGLWHNALSSIVEDNRGNFWMSSFGGVFRVARQELNEFADGKRAAVHCVGYNRNDGLPALESPGGFQPAGVRAADGRLWFPTVDGVASVDPEHIVDNKVPPPVTIEEVAVDGAPLTAQVGKGLEIPAGKRRLEFRFTALSFTAPEKVRFQHRLQGLESEWSQPDERRVITYNFVPPGRYTFQVKASNSDGVWNNEGAALGVEVAPWFWQTWWFKAGLGLALAMGLALAVRQWERQTARTRMETLERQHALERERSRIAQDIHDDLGASLTQIVFLSERVKQAGDDAAEVGRWNQRVASAAQQTIQSLDEIVWAVSPENDTLESLANYLARFAQEHLSLAGVRCVLDVMTVAPPIEVSAELRHNLLLGAREALQNAVTHARATEVRVGLELREDVLELCIADNGQGFDPERAPNGGHGLLNLRQRIEGIGGCVEITSQNGQGTMIRFTVPRERLSAQGKTPATATH